MILTKEYLTDYFFTLTLFSGYVEIFTVFSLLQISMYYSAFTMFKKKSQKKPLTFFYIGFLIFFLSLFLLQNDNLFCSFFALTDSYNVFYLNDYLSYVSKFFICIFVSLFFLSYTSKISLNNSFEYTVFVITSSLGSMIICSSNDFMTAYLGIELQSISFYLMSCSKKNSNYSIESGLKYFIIGSLSSAILLFGISLVYGLSGTLNFIDLKTFLFLMENKSESSLSLIRFGLMLVFFSFLIKLSVAPFHYWSLDVYESSDNLTTSFFVIIPKLGLFVLFVRVFYFNPFLFNSENYIFCCTVFSFLSILVGSLGGIEQRKLKTLLAYSSISHTGYLLLAFSAVTEESFMYIFYYLYIYMLSNLCFWLVFIFLKKKTEKHSKKNNKELSDLVLLYKSNPFLFFVILTTLFSLAGVPPLIGFLIKLNLFLSLIQFSFYLVSVMAILMTVISTFYYIRIVKIMCFENSKSGKLYYPVHSYNSILISSSFLLLILLFFKPNLIYLIVYKTFLLLF